MGEAAVREAFDKQAAFCRAFGAPAIGQLCAAIATTLDRSTAFGTRVLDWAGEPMADALQMRVTGGLNARIRAGALPALAALYPRDPLPDDAALRAALAEAFADPALLPWLDGPPQTNEVARSGVLYPGLLVIAAQTGLPLALRELGSSAGLNLRLDHYRYTLAGRDFGNPGAPVHLAPEWDGAPPPKAEVCVTDRSGVDVNPLDVTDPAMRARLQAFVWPEQRERVARFEAALAAAAADPPPIDKADAAAWVAANVTPTPGVAITVFHSIAWQYFPPATQAAITAHMERAGAAATAAAPLAWLRYEMDDPAAPQLPTLRLRLWPGEDRLLARAHPHGASVAWKL